MISNCYASIQGFQTSFFYCNLLLRVVQCWKSAIISQYFRRISAIYGMIKSWTYCMLQTSMVQKPKGQNVWDASTKWSVTHYTIKHCYWTFTRMWKCHAWVTLCTPAGLNSKQSTSLPNLTIQVRSKPRECSPNVFFGRRSRKCHKFAHI